MSMTMTNRTTCTSLARRTAALLLLATLLTACSAALADPADVDPLAVRAPDVELSDHAVRRAAAIALADARFAALLDDTPHTVEEVRLPHLDAPGVVATVGFDAPVDEADFPVDICAIDTGDPAAPITGIVWYLVDDEVAAVSPRWGDDLTCGY